MATVDVLHRQLINAQLDLLSQINALKALVDGKNNELLKFIADRASEINKLRAERDKLQKRLDNVNIKLKSLIEKSDKLKNLKEYDKLFSEKRILVNDLSEINNSIGEKNIAFETDLKDLKKKIADETKDLVSKLDELKRKLVIANQNIDRFNK